MREPKKEEYTTALASRKRNTKIDFILDWSGEEYEAINDMETLAREENKQLNARVESIYSWYGN